MKEYSLAIRIDKIKKLKEEGGGEISHICSKRWESLIEKGVKKVRFFDTIYNETCICKIVKIDRTKLLGKETIKIKVKIQPV
jgi:hypothetical protein